MTPISFPDDDIYENGIVVSIQPDMYDEFSVEIQIQSLSITEMITSLKIPQSNANLSSNNLFLHTHWYTPTVDKYYDNHKYIPKSKQYPQYYSKFQPFFFFFCPNSDGPILQFWWRLIPQAIMCM